MSGTTINGIPERAWGELVAPTVKARKVAVTWRKTGDNLMTTNRDLKKVEIDGMDITSSVKDLKIHQGMGAAEVSLTLVCNLEANTEAN